MTEPRNNDQMINDAQKGLTLTPASELRKRSQQGKVVTFPSGWTAQVKHVDLTELSARGIIPRALLVKALSGFPEIEKSWKTDQTDGEALTNGLLEVYQFQWAVMASALIYPRLVETATLEDEIEYSDVDDEDRTLLIGMCQQPVSQWEMFLSEQAKRVPLMGDIETTETTP